MNTTGHMKRKNMLTGLSLNDEQQIAVGRLTAYCCRPAARSLLPVRYWVLLLMIWLTQIPVWAQTNILIRVDSVLNDVSHHPIGINVNFFMDDDQYLQPGRSTVDALKAMGVKYLRYPGGEKSDMYLFSVPPYNRSQPTLARTGKGALGGRGKMIEHGSSFKYDVLDFDEFMQMCQAVEAEPVLVVAADMYLKDYPEGSTIIPREDLIKHAAAWVRYANIQKQYNVKYWMIGNESWHKDNEGSTPEIYAQDVIDFSRAMKAVDPEIYIIPNGNNAQWWEVVLPKVAADIDHISISNYPAYDYPAGYRTYQDTLKDLMYPVRTALEAIEKHLPKEKKEQVKLIVAEYGAMDWTGKWEHVNDMGHNLVNFEITGLQLLEPKILFSLFWNTRWIDNADKDNEIYDALDKEGQFNANGYGLAIWGNFLATKMVYTSSTVRIRTFASYDPEKQQLFIYILNKSDSEEAISLSIPGKEIEEVKQRWDLVGKNADDTDPVWRPVPFKISDDAIQLAVPGISITVVEYQLR